MVPVRIQAPPRMPQPRRQRHRRRDEQARMPPRVITTPAEPAHERVTEVIQRPGQLPRHRLRPPQNHNGALGQRHWPPSEPHDIPGQRAQLVPSPHNSNRKTRNAYPPIKTHPDTLPSRPDRNRVGTPLPISVNPVLVIKAGVMLTTAGTNDKEPWPAAPVGAPPASRKKTTGPTRRGRRRQVAAGSSVCSLWLLDHASRAN
jgi:hypothetical protein